MASELSDYCLSHIFGYLKPHDLVHISEEVLFIWPIIQQFCNTPVCQSWKQLAVKEWKKITELRDLDHEDFKMPKDEILVTIKVRDAKKIIVRAAPYIKVLKLFYQTHDYFIVGNHWYAVNEYLHTDIILKLLSEHATGISKVHFQSPPKAELVTSLLQSNEVKELGYYDEFNGYHQYIPTNEIEELNLHFEDVNQDYTSFEGLFQNLKTLKLHINIANGNNPKDLLSQMLPYVLDIKSLHLDIRSATSNFGGMHEMLHGIFQLTKLEELSLLVTFTVPYNDETGDVFFTKLRECCTKLRVLKIHLFEECLKKNNLSFLMSLPDLEFLDIRLPLDFPTMEFYQMDNLSALKMTFLYANPDVSGFLNAVRKMPKLKKIDLFFDYGITEANQFQLVCDVVSAAASQKKDIFVTPRYYFGWSKTLAIRKSVNSEVPAENTLHFTTEFYHKEKTIFERVKEYVREKLYHYHAVISHS